MKPSPCSWPSGAGNPASSPAVRSAGGRRRAAREYLSLSSPGPAPNERGRASARWHLQTRPTRSLPGNPRRLSNGPTYFRRAEVRTRRDSLCWPRRVKRGHGLEERGDDLRTPATEREASAWASGAEGRQRSEDGAEARQPAHKLGSLCRKDGRAQSPRRSRVRRRCGTWVPL